MELFIELFLIVIALCIILNVIFKHFDLPTIIGYVIAGIVLSHIYDLSSNKDDLEHIAEFGIVFLMFTIGLEFSFKRLLKMKKDVFLNGSLQLILTGIVYAVMLHLILGTDRKIALVIGLSLSLSSTAIVLKMLNDSGNVKKVYGRKIIGILLLQDLGVIPILLMADIFTNENTGHTGPLIIRTIVSAIFVIGFIYLIGKHFFDKLFAMVLKTNSEEIFISTVLFVVIGCSFIAHIFNFSYTLGAFLSGMMISETRYKHEVMAKLISFRDLLLGLFFITVGMQLNFHLIYNKWYLIIFFVAVIMIIKIIVTYYAMYLFKETKRVSMKISLSLCQIGEFGLVVFSLLISKSAITLEHGQILIAATIISMIITPFIMKKLEAITKMLVGEDLLAKKQDIDMRDIKNHIIVCGYGRFGQKVVANLKGSGKTYVIVDNDLELVELGRQNGEKIFYGSMTNRDMLNRLNIQEASSVILTVLNETKLELIANIINSLAIPVKIVVAYSGVIDKALFEECPDNFIFVEEEEIMAKILVKEAVLYHLPN